MKNKTKQNRNLIERREKLMLEARFLLDCALQEQFKLNRSVSPLI